MPTTVSYPSTAASYRSPLGSVSSAKTSNAASYYNNSLVNTSPPNKYRDRVNFGSETQRPLLASENESQRLEYNLSDRSRKVDSDVVFRNDEHIDRTELVQLANKTISADVYKSLEDVQEIQITDELSPEVPQQSSGFNSDVPEYQNANNLE